MKKAIIICGGNLDRITEAKRFFEARDVKTEVMAWPNLSKLNELRRDHWVAALILDSQVDFWRAWCRRNKIYVTFCPDRDS